MPKFLYKAKSFKGAEDGGVMEAANEEALAKILREKGYFLVSAEIETKKGKNKNSFLVALQGVFGVPLTEKLLFTRNLEVMVKTGVALPRAFKILSVQAKTKKFKKALLGIEAKIMKGDSLSNCIGAYPGIFSTLYQETMKIGEETGKLDEALHILAIQMEREHKIKSDIKTAMVYPMVVMIMAFMIGIFMFIFAVPQLKESFAELNVNLPFTTRAIFGFADFLIEKWSLAILLFSALFVAFFIFLRSKKTGRIKSAILLNIPIVSKINKTTNSALTLRTLSSLLAAGVPIIKTLEVASGALNNYYYKISLKEASKVVEKGEKLSHALSSYENIYSPVVIQMIEVGEETGETPKVLSKLADFYEEEVASATKKLSSIIEPVLILIIGGIVGFFAISMMQPMFSMMGGI